MFTWTWSGWGSNIPPRSSGGTSAKVPATVNVWCPNCQTRFGCTLRGEHIKCPLCHHKQNLPIIHLDANTLYCANCESRFGDIPGREPECVNCHVKQQVA